MKVWLDDRDTFLDEFLRNNGRGDSMQQVTCIKCEVEMPQYRCSDCFGGDMYCKACILTMHAANPLHSAEVRASIL